MKRYGLRIGTCGVEFASKDERDKALLAFTKGGTVRINTCAGLRYEDDGDPSFGTYERESQEVLANCTRCKGTFSVETCTEREYPSYASWRKEKWVDERGFICDGCFAKAVKDKEIADARARLEAATTATP